MLFVSCDIFGGGGSSVVTHPSYEPTYEYKDAFVTIINTSDVSLSVTGVRTETAYGTETTSVSIDIPNGESKTISFRYISTGSSTLYDCEVLCTYMLGGMVNTSVRGTKKGETVTIDSSYYSKTKFTNGCIINFLKTTDGKYVLARVENN